MCDSIAEGGRRCKHQTASSRKAYRERRLRAATTAEARARAEEFTSTGCYARAGVTNLIEGKTDEEIEALRPEVNALLKDSPELNPFLVRMRRTKKEMQAQREREEAEAQRQRDETADGEALVRKRTPKAIVAYSTNGPISREIEEDPDAPKVPKTQPELLDELRRLRASKLAALQRSFSPIPSTSAAAKDEIVNLDAEMRAANDELFALINSAG